MQVKSERKIAKCSSLHSELSLSYNRITFFNISMGAIGAMDNSYTSFCSLLNKWSCDKTIRNESF